MHGDNLHDDHLHIPISEDFWLKWKSGWQFGISKIIIIFSSFLLVGLGLGLMLYSRQSVWGVSYMECPKVEIIHRKLNAELHDRN